MACDLCSDRLVLELWDLDLDSGLEASTQNFRTWSEIQIWKFRTDSDSRIEDSNTSLVIRLPHTYFEIQNNHCVPKVRSGNRNSQEKLTRSNRLREKKHDIYLRKDTQCQRAVQRHFRRVQDLTCESELHAGVKLMRRPLGLKRWGKKLSRFKNCKQNLI